MITEEIINYLNDETIQNSKKYLFLRNLNLSYGDLFELRSIYKYECDIFNIISGLSFYSDSKLHEKIKKQNRKIERSKKEKRIRQVK